MFGKILIKAEIEVLTGMHIGGSNMFSAIGAVDSTVARDTATKMPIIPGSSIKGKMRTLLEKSIENNILIKNPNSDSPQVKRLFGSSNKGNIKKARLQFCDSFLINKDELNRVGVTEVKTENMINRGTAVAMPRSIERVIKGAKFGFQAIYDIEEENEIEEDFRNMVKALNLLQMDYLGGHGTRGYGRVKISNLTISDETNTLNADYITKLQEILKDVK